MSAIIESILDSLGDFIDAALDITLVVLTLITLSGCTLTSEEVETATYHPAWPTPYEVCDVKWEVFVIEKEPYVALSFEDNLKLAVCTQDLIRYLKEMNIKFCTYRPQEDSRCAQLFKTEKESS